MEWTDNKKANSMVPQSWIIYCLKMYKISNKVINFITETMKNWRVELIAEGKTLTSVEIISGDALSPLLFVKSMVPSNNILWKCTGGNNFTTSQETIYHLRYMDDIKLFAKKWKRIGDSYTNNMNIQLGHRNRIRHWKMCHINYEKRKRQITEGIELPN